MTTAAFIAAAVAAIVILAIIGLWSYEDNL
jgi:hypothetical protein